MPELALSIRYILMNCHYTDAIFMPKVACYFYIFRPYRAPKIIVSFSQGSTLCYYIPPFQGLSLLPCPTRLPLPTATAISSPYSLLLSPNPHPNLTRLPLPTATAISSPYSHPTPESHTTAPANCNCKLLNQSRHFPHICNNLGCIIPGHCR